MNYRPSSWLDQLVGLCFSLLVAAAMLYEAIRLIQAVWMWLVVVTSLVGVGALSWSWLRYRSNRW